MHVPERAQHLGGGTITNSAVGVQVETVNAGTHTATVPISGGVSITGGTTGILVNGPTASVAFTACSHPSAAAAWAGRPEMRG